MDNLDLNHGVAPRGKGTEVGTILQLQTCPYNESHRVGHGSFASHLHKCRMALKEKERERYVICEYNQTHHMFKEVYEDHLKICTDYRYYQSEKFYISPEFYGHPKPKVWLTPKDKLEREKKEMLMNAQKRKEEEQQERAKRDAEESEISDSGSGRNRVLVETVNKTVSLMDEEESFFVFNNE